MDFFAEHVGTVSVLFFLSFFLFFFFERTKTMDQRTKDHRVATVLFARLRLLLLV